jgi:hypothetical protein
MSKNICRICQLPNVQQLNARISEGCNLVTLAEEIILPYHAVYYHAKNHVSKNLKDQSVELQNNTLDDLVTNKGRLELLLEKSIEKNQTQNALKIMIELRAISEMYMRVSSNGLQSRISELEAENNMLKNNTNANNTSIEERTAQFHEYSKNLSNNELILYGMIVEKMEARSEEIIIPDFPGEYLSHEEIANVAANRIKALNGKMVRRK